jgi:hypothetical protein
VTALAHAGEGEKVLDEHLHAPRAVHGVRDIRVRARVELPAVAVGEELRVAAHHAQGLLQVVARHRRELLQLGVRPRELVGRCPERGVEPPLLGDVADDGGVPHRAVDGAA